MALECGMELPPGEVVHSNPWFMVKDRGGYFTIEYHQPQVIVLPIVDDKAIVLIKAIRPVLGSDSWELPAGGVLENEPPVEAARRELQEETGIFIPDSKRLEILVPIIHAPNRTSECVHIFQVNLTRQEFDARGAHDHEVSGVACLSFPEIRRMATRGDIYVSAVLALIGRYLMSRMDI